MEIHDLYPWLAPYYSPPTWNSKRRSAGGEAGPGSGRRSFSGGLESRSYEEREPAAGAAINRFNRGIIAVAAIAETNAPAPSQRKTRM
jgi:hypothetical protein